MCNVGRLCLLVIAALGLLATGVSADDFYDNFDNYTANVDVIGQAGPPGGWEGWDGSATAGAPVKDDFAYSSPYSIMIAGPNTDLVHQFAGATSGQWTLSAMQYVPSGGAGSNYFIVMNQYTVGADPKAWAVQLNANMDAGTIASDIIGGGATLPLVVDDWAEIRFDIDLDANTAEVFYNGASLASGPWTAADPAVTEIAAIDLWPASESPAYYDNISLTQVPEPATLTMLAGVGFCGLFVLRRRRR